MSQHNDNGRDDTPGRLSVLGSVGAFLYMGGALGIGILVGLATTDVPDVVVYAGCGVLGLAAAVAVFLAAGAAWFSCSMSPFTPES